MADFSISLSDVQDTRTVEIKGLGDLTARKLGSGEGLQLSLNQRRMRKIFEELDKMDFTKFDTSNPEDLKKILALTKKAESLSDEIEEINKHEFNTYRRLLSDNKDGKVVDVIMDTLTDRARGELLKRIFGEVKEIKTPDQDENTDNSSEPTETKGE